MAPRATPEDERVKELKRHCCGLVLYNRDKPLVDLRPMFVYGAMLGNVAIQLPLNAETGLEGFGGERRENSVCRRRQDAAVCEGSAD